MAEKLSITLPADMVSTIKARVAGGDYASTSEVLREAMRLWLRREQEHEERLAAIRARIQNTLSDTRPSAPADEAFSRLIGKFEKLAQNV